MNCLTTMYLALGPMDAIPRPPSVTWVDSEDVPVRCHWEDEADASKCDLVFESLADAWAVQVDTIGFAEPIPDSDGLLDIYITDDGTAGGAYTMGTYTDDDESDGRTGCSAWIAIDEDLSRSLIPEYIAHEFNHVLQFATDFNEDPEIPWEATASIAERWTYSYVDVDDWWVEDFQRDPWVGLSGDSYDVWDEDGYWSGYEYGAAAWMMHLDHFWGDGAGSAGAALWWASAQDTSRNEPDFVDAYDEVSGDWRAAWMDLSVDRARFGTSHVAEWAEDFELRYFQATRDSELSADDLPFDVEPDILPFHTGLFYVDIDDLTPGQELVLDVTSEEEEVTWGLLVVDGDEDGWVQDSSYRWPLVGDDVTVGVVHLGGDDYDADDRLEHVDVVLSIDQQEPLPPEDTGEVDTGEAPPADGDDDDEGGGCGCAVTSRASWAPLPLALLALARRRP